MKRGILYTTARKNGYNVLVLGQHLDDCAESLVMSAFRNGLLRTMKAHYLNDAEDIRIIRPLVYARERATREFADAMRLPIITDNCPACYSGPTERYHIKKLLGTEEATNAQLFPNLRRTMRPLLAAGGARAIRTVALQVDAEIETAANLRRGGGPPGAGTGAGASGDAAAAGGAGAGASAAAASASGSASKGSKGGKTAGGAAGGGSVASALQARPGGLVVATAAAVGRPLLSCPPLHHPGLLRGVNIADAVAAVAAAAGAGAVAASALAGGAGSEPSAAAAASSSSSSSAPVRFDFVPPSRETMRIRPAMPATFGVGAGDCSLDFEEGED